jgi:GTP-binding protein
MAHFFSMGSAPKCLFFKIMSIQNLRNIAIVAHVDHGKTTLVDKLLQQSGTLDAWSVPAERIMDSNDLEQERGITILSKNTAVRWKDYRINIVDTPGHADFGGEVERILSMVDCVLLLVDAVDGPMPQTRFVTQKAFAKGLNPILVVNKIDRDGARPDWVVDQVFDLFDKLGATDKQMDFPVIYTSAIGGYARYAPNDDNDNMEPLFETIIKEVSPPDVDPDAPFQMQISSLDYSSYVGTIGIGRITRGRLAPRQNVRVVDASGKTRDARVLQVLELMGVDRREIDGASAGDIVAISGVEPLTISDTLCDPNHVEALPPLSVDEPTITMVFQVNDSPFAGREGQYVTSRKLDERLQQELLHNIALRVKPMSDPNKFEVSGRGELHLGILIENMRREGYELAISRPHVIIKEIDGVMNEPVEQVTVDIEEQHQGALMEKLGDRGGLLQDMQNDGKGRVRLDYLVPTRGLIGFHNIFLNATSGSGLLYHVFDHYAPLSKESKSHRSNGVMISNALGKSSGFALWNLQERGALFIGPQTEVYEGMIVGSHARDNDLVVNVCREKQLTNVRASGKDDNIMLTPPLKFSLEQAMEFIDEDELVEVTPESIRMRKKLLKEHERKRAGREK